MHSPFDTLHTRIVSSQDPDAKNSPSGENTTLHIWEEWPVSVLMHSSFDTLHTPIVLFQDPDAKYSPLGENTRLKTWEEFGSRI